MAIKRLRLNDDGEMEERTLQKSELPPPPPKPAPAARRPRIGSAGSSSRASSENTGAKRVKVTQRASKVYASGKTALDHDVIRFECKKCGSSRVGTDETQGLTCSMCGIPMTKLR